MPPDNQETLLVIEHEPHTMARVRDALRGPERRLLSAATAREALSLLGEVVPDLVVADLDAPDLGGPELVETLRRTVRGLRVIGLTRRPAMALGVQAMRAGAEDVLDLPLNRAMLHAAVDRALHESRSRSALARAREALADRAGLSRFLSRSPRMLRVFDQIRAVAGTDATVLIRGETGTGKELVSKAIHERSARQDQPFIAINCGAFTESLLESELFGHEKGSFTGAAGRRRGVFEMADGGTLFLDELGETSLNVQVTLLRVLEEMRFRRVGGHDLVPVDVRIVAATNVDLETAVADGEFRQDLYYRLNVFPITLPPLRERPEDIPLLARHFLEDAAEDYGIAPPTLTPEAMGCVTRYAWPGNVRQLRALCERWVIVGAGGELDLTDLPPDMTGASATRLPPGTGGFEVDPSQPMKVAVDRVTEEIEQRYLQRVLQLNEGHLTRTAEAAGITRRTLYTKM
jgi:DNA-binding NtrC family response regulator